MVTNAVPRPVIDIERVITVDQGGIGKNYSRERMLVLLDVGKERLKRTEVKVRIGCG